MAATFDTLRAARRLKEAGAGELMAEAIAEVLRDSREIDLAQLATKGDIEKLRADIDQLRLSTKAGIDQLQLSTKADINELRLSAKADINELRLSAKADIDQLRMFTRADVAELRSDLAEVKSEVLKWVIGLMIAQTAVIVALVKLISSHP